MEFLNYLLRKTSRLYLLLSLPFSVQRGLQSHYLTWMSLDVEHFINPYHKMMTTWFYDSTTVMKATSVMVRHSDTFSLTSKIQYYNIILLYTIKQITSAIHNKADYVSYSL